MKKKEEDDRFDAEEIFDIIRNIQDPEHPNTLEELGVVSLEQIEVLDDDDETAAVVSSSSTTNDNDNDNDNDNNNNVTASSLPPSLIKSKVNVRFT